MINKYNKDFKKLQNRIVSWWNDNGFLGYFVESLNDIQDLIEDSQYKNIKDMLEYHQEQSDLDNLGYDYFSEMKEKVFNEKENTSIYGTLL